MPESVDRIDDQTAELDIISYQKVNYLVFLVNFYIKATSSFFFYKIYVFL